MFKKIIIALFFALSILNIASTNVQAASEPLNIYLFWGDGCPHCAKEKAFFKDYLPKHKNVKLNMYEVYYNEENVQLMKSVMSKLNIESGGVPLLVIGDEPIVGYADNITDKKIEAKIESCTNSKCNDTIASIIEEKSKKTEPKEEAEREEKQNTDNNISLPIIGNINTANFSLPILTIIMGLLDGFNPCAMWALIFLISLLINFKDRKKMWILGSAFIFASAICYSLFMIAWLKLIMFLGFVIWVRLAIGVISVAGGACSVKKGIDNKNGGCSVSGNEKRQEKINKIKDITKNNSLWIALGGIILLAFAINLIELICSAGLPAVYTQILALNNLPSWQYYGYIALYILFFMLDDLIIFAIAMTTLKLTGVSTKYSKYSNIIGGILMLIIGIMLIFKPELLMFG